MLPILAYTHSSFIHHPILLGHFKLWKLGFEHRDPSLANLMIDPETKCAVLNDWDLSYHPSFLKSVQPHGERTGTVPFMAVDLLCQGNWAGNRPRLYRHDLEGLIWILPWVFLQYEESTFKIRKLESWSTGDYEKCATAKNQMIKSLEAQIPMDSWRDQWFVAQALLDWLQGERARRTLALVVQRSVRRKQPVYVWEDEDDVLGSQDVVEEFASKDKDSVQQLVGGCHVEGGRDDSAGLDNADENDSPVEPAAGEVYQSFCQLLYGIPSLHPALQALRMTPSSDD